MVCFTPQAHGDQSHNDAPPEITVPPPAGEGCELETFDDEKEVEK